MSDIDKKNQELDIAVHQQIKAIEDMLEEMGKESMIQEVVIHKQITNEIPEVSGDNIQETKERLLEVETIEERLHDIEDLQFRLQEVEMLEKKLIHVSNRGRKPLEKDDWCTLLEYRPLVTSSASTGKNVARKCRIMTTTDM